MHDRLRPFVWPLTLMLLAATLFVLQWPDVGTDLDVYHTAATRVLGGVSPYQADDTRPFTYLPVLAVLLTPFGLFRLEAAQALWFAVSAGLLTAVIRWSIHGLPERRRSDESLQWGVLLVMLPFFAHELLAGQLTVLLGTLLVAALLAVQVDLPRVAGVLLGVAIVIEPYAVVLLPWLALAHGLAALTAAVMVLAVGLLAPALLFGWTGNVHMLVAWFRLVSDAPLGAVGVAENASVGAMFVKWLGLTRLALFLGVIAMTALLGLVATVWVHRKHVLEPDYLDVALVLLLIPLLSAHSPVWLFLLATPAVACLLDRWRELPPGWRAATGVALTSLAVGSAALFNPVLAGLLDRSAALSLAGLLTAVVTANIRWKRLA